jgi:DNA-binding response OmpR family regulator
MPEPRAGYILAVDDDPDMRALLRVILSGAGYEVDLASDGEDALAAMERRRPDLVILDMLMPGLNGWGVIRRMPAGAPPVIVMSGEYLAPAALGMGPHAVHGYVVKPFESQALLDTCSSILDPASVAPAPANRERRTDPRVRLNAPASLVQADRRPLAVGRVVDVSRSGLRLRLGTNLVPGQKLRLELGLPDGEDPMHLRGEARWARDGRAGVALVEVDDESQRRIEAFIAGVMRRSAP